MDTFDFGTQARASLIDWAGKNVPELVPFFPFQRFVRFKTHFGAPYSIAITDDGPGAMSMDTGGDYPSSESEIAEVLLSAANAGDPPTFDAMYAALGERFYRKQRFTYVGPYRGGRQDYDMYAPFLGAWVAKCVMPTVLEENRRRVMHAAPKEVVFDAGTIGNSVLVLESKAHTEQGTAFALEGVGFVTNHHTLQPDTKAFLSSDRTKLFDVKVIASEPTVDLAIIEISGLTVPSLQRGTADNLRELDSLLVVGFPNHNFQDTPFFVSGRVAGFRIRSSIRRVMTDAAIVSGMSGGPVLDSTLKVIGVATTGAQSFATAKNTEDHGIVPIDSLMYLRAQA